MKHNCRHRKKWRAIAISLFILLTAWNFGVKGDDSKGLNTYELLTLQDIETFSLSPDGRLLAFITRRADLDHNTYDCKLYVIELGSGGSAKLLGTVSPAISRVAGYVGGFIPRKLHWALNGSMVTYVSNFDGLDQVWAWNVAGGPPRRLTNAATDVLSHDVIADGNTIFFTTLGTKGTLDEHSKIEHSARANGMLFRRPLRWGDYLGERGIAQYVANTIGVTFDHWIVDAKSGRSRSARTADLAAFPVSFPGQREITFDLYAVMGAVPMLSRPPEVAVSNDLTRTASVMTTPSIKPTRGSDGMREYAILVGARNRQDKIEWYRRSEAAISSLKWSPDGAYLYFYQQEYTKDGLKASVCRITGPGTEPNCLYSTNDTVGPWTEHGVLFDNTTTKAVFLQSSATRTERLVMLDLAKGTLTTVYDPNPWLAKKDLGTPTFLTWANRYGVKCYGYLVKPFDLVDGKKYPLVVVTYRASGFLRGGIGDEYPVYPLARAGFAVLVLDIGDVRAYPEEGDDETIYRRHFSQRSTIEEGLRAVEKYSFVDISRAGITGLSYGSFIVWDSLIASNWFKAAISSDGAETPTSFLLRGITNSFFTRTFRLPIITEEYERRWKRIGESFNAGKIRAPILINDSDNEFESNLEMVTTMSELGKPFELFIYPHSGHNINQPTQRYSVYNRNIDWMRFWLKNEEDNNPAKAEQYSRWRRLRMQHEWNERLIREGTDPTLEFFNQSGAKMRNEKIDPSKLAPMLAPDQ